MNARAPGRPRVLSRERIVTVARRIADGEGLDALTVRRVAQHLGTGQASLYRHIEDRDELLRLLAEDVALQLPVPKGHPDPRERIVGQWLDAYDYLSRHRWAARIIAEGEHAADGAAAFSGSALETLGALSGDAEPSRTELTRVYRVLWHLLLGHVLNAHPLGHADTEGTGEVETPPGTAEADGMTSPEHPTPRDDFAWALPRVLDGLLGTS
ncbi:TetR/AcrR family transcriptional regulator [Streptomyces sp. NPDC057245]|uniref:TetR/AcrR family transcriptional regulator n=1 Tax=Streptomyces TaxID=1883 RepID=UPI001C1DF338|nr:TetR/AcrR family transcriptional regulator [Streptomyces sp. A108]MBU6534028.1 TetR/AcrR family transcriptional regulator [Streptomyces sp. A108]